MAIRIVGASHVEMSKISEGVGDNIMSEWQPIKTMPVEQYVLVFTPTGMTVAYISYKDGTLWLDESFGCNDRITDATHWMPLPEPPK